MSKKRNGYWNAQGKKTNSWYSKSSSKVILRYRRIKRRILGESASYKKKKKKLSKVSQALELFSKNKTSIDVAIELDLDPKDVEKVHINYLGLNGLSQLVNETSD